MATFPRHIPAEKRVLAPRADRHVSKPETVYKSKLPGDTRALRGIPAIGRGVAGAINGSNPDKVTRYGA